jgi:hypothetical protein
MECWPALVRFDVTRFFWYKSFDDSKKCTRYEFGLGQGILGMKSGKKIYSTKNVESNLYDDSRQISIFCFSPKNTPMLQEYQYNFMSFDSSFL